MNRFMTSTSIALALLALTLGANPSGAALLQTTGKVTFLRVHDVGTGFGPSDDQIDVEVVFRLDSQPRKAFGFQVRDDANRAARQGMLDLLRDAFEHGWTVVTDFEVDDPDNDNNGVAIRVALTGNQQRTAYQYAAKFVCGEIGKESVLASGIYFTAINVHNGGSEAVSVKKRFAVALPGEEAGPVSEVVEARLRSGEAFEIDCPDISRHVRASGFVKGFVTLESRTSLDVVGVYAAARPSDGQVVSEEIERVPGRKIPLRLPDLLPVPDADGSFCRRSGNRLLVTVANKGEADASATTTEVDFLEDGKRTTATPALTRGGSATLQFAVPAGAFDGEGTHPFLITADLLHQEEESNEANNFAEGRCVVID